MEVSLKRIIKQGETLKVKGLLEGYQAFQDWHEGCIEFLEGLTLTFRETVRTPLDVEKGIAWFMATFQRD